jgi:NTP pyrophosphatase (non-canonical NTP hydrolase)
MTLRELQQAIDRYIGQFEAGYWPPLANLARLTEEVGELARELNHAHGPKPKKSTEREGSVEGELGDILFAVATLANSLGIDLEEAAASTLRKVETRDASRWARRDGGPDAQ